MLLTIIIILGAFFGFANPVLDAPPLVLVLPAGLCLLAMNQPNWRKALRAGWLAGTLAYGACLYWVAVPVHDYGNLSWLLALPCPVLLGMYMGVYTGLFALGVRLAAVHLGWLGHGLFAGSLWSLLEVLRGTLFTGFPWLTLPQAFAPWPSFLQGASLVGAVGFSALLAMAACLPTASAIRGRSRFKPLILTLVIAGGLAAQGNLSIADPMPVNGTVNIGIVQANINQAQKWSPEYQNATIDRYTRLTLGIQAQQPTDIVFWPETAMPFYLQDGTALQARVLRLAKMENLSIVTGAPGYQRLGGDEEYLFYNRAYLVSPDGVIEGSYDKTRLVPFGEYIPLKGVLGFLSRMVESEGDFSPGLSAAPLKKDNVAMGMLICYETIFPDLVQKRVAAGANLLVNLSNDAWFGRTSAPRQHLHQSVLRAIEQGRYLIRATNTGVSALIDPHGRILVRGDLFRAQALGAQAGLVSTRTLYHRLHGYVVPTLGLLTALLALLAMLQPTPGYEAPREGRFPQHFK